MNPSTSSAKTIPSGESASLAGGEGLATDDLYSFDVAGLQVHPLRLQPYGFDLPESALGASSALLRMRVRANGFGRWQGPRLEFARDGTAGCRFAFEPGGQGIRYLDISGLLQPAHAGREVRCLARGMRWPGTAELLVFPEPSVQGERTLVLAPHPDDAEIAAYGLYRHTDAAVVTITAGDAGGSNYGHIEPDPARQRDLKSRLRVWDSLTVPLWAGLSPDRVANLGYHDETLASMRAHPDRDHGPVQAGRMDFQAQRRALVPGLLRPGARPCWTSLVADLVHLIRTIRPRIIVAPHPQLDAHVDHRMTTQALIEALAQVEPQDGSLFLYVNHPVQSARWPSGPPRMDVTLPPNAGTMAALCSFHSHPLEPQDQIDKLFAIEAMHDMRRSPPSITRRREWGLLSAAWEARDAILRSHLGTFSYVRRAVRAREIFFVYRMRDHKRLAQP